MKKKNLLLSLAFSALLLTSCGKVTADFPNKDNPLTNSPITIDHNTLDVIYKQIRNGSTFTSDVKDLLAREIAKVVLGNYQLVASDDEGGYKVSLVDYESSNDKAAWIASHPAYNNWETSAYTLTLAEAAPSTTEFESRVKTISDLIDAQVVSTLWSEANVDSYKRNNRFYEVLYARNINDKKLYEINNPSLTEENYSEVLRENPTYKSHINYDENGNYNGFKKMEADSDEAKLNGFTDGVLIDGKFDAKTVEGRKNIKKVLHVNYYLDYINKTILPTIMTNLLVEQYVLTEQYSAIGTTQSREVNYIKIADNSAKNGLSYVTSFVKNYITSSNEKVSSVFTSAETGWKGIASDIDSDEKAKTLAESTFGKATDKNPSAGRDGHVSAPESGQTWAHTYYDHYADYRAINYYNHTEFNDLVETFSTITNDSNTNNLTNQNNFTTINSVNYEAINGFDIKSDDIRVKDFITEGWETRDNTALPDAIKSSLYSYSFTNEWNGALGDGTYEGTYIYKNQNGDKFLTKQTYNSREDSLIWNDGSNYYVVQVNDIITPEIVSLNSSTTNKAEIEKKARTAGYTLASGTTYTTNALTYYLKQSNINYHDQDVYDYFVTTFPQLFE